MKFKAAVLAVAYLTTARGNDPCSSICEGGSGGGSGGGNIIIAKPVATVQKQQPVCNCATGRGYSPGGGRGGGGGYAPPPPGGYGGYGGYGGGGYYQQQMHLIPIPVPTPPPQPYMAPPSEPPKEKIITTTVMPQKSMTPVCSITTIEECKEEPVEPEVITMHVPDKPAKNDTPPPPPPPPPVPPTPPVMPITIPVLPAPPAPPTPPPPPPPPAPPANYQQGGGFPGYYYLPPPPPPRPAPRPQPQTSGGGSKEMCICDTAGGSGGNYQEGSMNCADQTNIDLAACREGNSYPVTNISNVEVPLAPVSQKANPPVDYSSGCPC